MTKSNSQGVSFTTVLFLIFLILKLTNTITWSWWWVTAPLWFPVAVVFLAVVMMAIVSVVCLVPFKITRRKK
jgi:uncharacterized integral membrane protein